MVGIKTLSLLAIAGSVLAAPQPRNVVTENEIVYTTVMVTVTAGQEPTPTPQVQQPAPTPEVQVTTTPAPAAPAPSAYSPPAPAPSSGGSDDGSYCGIVNKYRAMQGLPGLSTDGTLVANALKTCQDSGGQLNHELNPGSMAQVLAPGSPDEFDKVCFGGWFCELGSLWGGLCDEASKGWSYDGQTGHADILLSKSYTKCGCANAEGVWGCDLA